MSSCFRVAPGPTRSTTPLGSSRSVPSPPHSDVARSMSSGAIVGPARHNRSADVGDRRRRHSLRPSTSRWRQSACDTAPGSPQRSRNSRVVMLPRFRAAEFVRRPVGSTSAMPTRVTAPTPRTSPLPFARKLQNSSHRGDLRARPLFTMSSPRNDLQFTTATADAEFAGSSA